MKTKQKFILCTSGESFDSVLNQALDNGAQVVSDTISIQETGSGRQWFSCVVEYEVAPHGSESLPDLEDDTPDNEAGKLASIEKLMMGFAAASNSEYVQLQYDNYRGNWTVFRDWGNHMSIVPNSVTDNPFRSLAAAIKHVTKDVL